MFRRAVHTLIALVLGTAAMMNCANDLAGGSQVGNPAVIAGAVVDSSGSPAAGVSVALTPENGFSAKPYSLGKEAGRRISSANTADPGASLFSTTDTRGRYRFHNVPDETYRLFLHDSAEGTMFQKPDIYPRSDSLFLGRDTLSLPGRVVITVPDSQFEPGALLVIPGTPLSFQTDTPGGYSLLLPPGNLNLSYYSPTGDSLIPLRDETDEIRVHSNVTTYVGERSITTPEVQGSRRVGTFSREYAFTIHRARSSHEEPLEYRFDWGNGHEFSAWIADSTALHQWPTSSGIIDTIHVRGAARLKNDPPIMSSWSEPFPIILSNQPLLLPPHTPVGETMPTRLDSAVYTSGGATFNLDDKGVEYRFSAGDFFVSDWQADSTVAIHWTMPGVFRLVTSARPGSSEHSDKIAVSDTLSIFVH